MLVTANQLAADPAPIFARMGWELRPEGACNGPVCVPLGDASSVGEVADSLGMPIVTDAAQAVCPLIDGRRSLRARSP